MIDYQSLPPNTKLVEELVPKIRLQLDSETTPQYLNYIFDTIEEALFKEFSIIGDMDRSPVVKLWKMSGNPNPFDLEDVSHIHKLIKQITLIQNSLRSRIGLQHKRNFYLIWRLYEEGKSWNEIYEITNKLEPYTMDRDNTIRNLKKSYYFVDIINFISHPYIYQFDPDVFDDFIAMVRKNKIIYIDIGILNDTSDIFKNIFIIIYAYSLNFFPKKWRKKVNQDTLVGLALIFFSLFTFFLWAIYFYYKILIIILFKKNHII